LLFIRGQFLNVFGGISQRHQAPVVIKRYRIVKPATNPASTEMRDPEE